MTIAGVDPAVRPCRVHSRHTPRPLVTVVHHIQPQGMGGPDEPGNTVDCCDSGHRNIHTLMGELVTADTKGGPVPVLTRGTKEEQRLAIDGYARWVAAGRPGSPHAAYAMHGLPG
jgi:hypothetical protein